MPTSAYFSKQKISISQVSVKEPGYIFVYLSYEDQSNNYVQFDDFKITHTKSNLIQANEYYPFGMQTANSWTRENNTGNNFLANRGTELNPTSSLYDLAFRNYDPVLGRMNGVDPMASMYSSLTPYNFSFNDPVTFTDPSGADPDRPGDPDFTGSYMQAIANGWSPGMAPMTIMDPGGGGSSTWNPATAGGYGVGGDWSLAPLGGIISSYNPNYAGPVQYVDNMGSMRYALPTDIEAANRAAFISGAPSVGTIVWNPWDGEEVSKGIYKGGWVNSSAHLINKILEKGYVLHVKRLTLVNTANQQDTHYPSSAELHERFGPSNLEKFFLPMLAQFQNKNFMFSDLVNYVQKFDYSSLEDTKKQLSLRLVNGNITVTSGTGVRLNQEFVYGIPPSFLLPRGEGYVSNPGLGNYLGPLGVPEFKDGYGNVVRFSVALEVVRGF